MVHIFTLSTPEAEAGGALQSEFQTSQGYKEKLSLEKTVNNNHNNNNKEESQFLRVNCLNCMLAQATLGDEEIVLWL